MCMKHCLSSMGFQYDIVQLVAFIDICRFMQFRVARWIISNVVAAISWRLTAFSSLIVFSWYL